MGWFKFLFGSGAGDAARTVVEGSEAVGLAVALVAELAHLPAERIRTAQVFPVCGLGSFCGFRTVWADENGVVRLEGRFVYRGGRYDRNGLMLSDGCPFAPIIQVRCENFCRFKQELRQTRHNLTAEVGVPEIALVDESALLERIADRLCLQNLTDIVGRSYPLEIAPSFRYSPSKAKRIALMSTDEMPGELANAVRRFAWMLDLSFKQSGFKAIAAEKSATSKQG